MRSKGRNILAYCLLFISIMATLWMFYIGVVLIEALVAAIAEEEYMYYYEPSPITGFLESVYNVSPPLAMFLIFLGAPPIGPIIVLMFWITTLFLMMSRKDEKDAIRSLRDGFSFSLITVSALLAILLLSWSGQISIILFFTLPLVFACFILSLYNRIKAWDKLKQNSIKWALLCEIIIFLIVFCFAGFCPILFWLFGSIVFILPMIAWIIATYMEARGFEWVKQNLNINLSLSKKTNILGIIFFIIGISIQFTHIVPYLQLTIVAFLFSYPILFSYPFLIASCLSSITKLKPKPS